jgi:hypothetical protein
MDMKREILAGHFSGGLRTARMVSLSLLLGAVPMFAADGFNRSGHFLIADQGNNRAIEVTHGDQIVKTFTAGGPVSIVGLATRLTNGQSLLTDSGNSRAVELDAHDNAVWQYVTNTDPLSIAAPRPTRALRLRGG